jgi:hypothetical protein
MVLGAVAVLVFVPIMLVSTAAGRWAAARLLGVRGISFPFGASSKWSWTTRSVVPQALVAGTGVAAAYVLCGALMAAGASSVGRDRPDETSLRVNVSPGGPAYQAGLQDGDRIDAVQGEPVATWNALRAATRRHPGEPIELAVTRGGSPLRIVVVPDSAGFIHVSVPVQRTEATLGDCLAMGVVGPARVLNGELASLWNTVANSKPAPVMGPVAIVHETARQSAPGPGNALVFLGLVGAQVLPVCAVMAVVGLPGRRKPVRAAGRPARRQ